MTEERKKVKGGEWERPRVDDCETYMVIEEADGEQRFVKQNSDSLNKGIGL